MYPEALEKLIEDFRMLPGVGRKTAERYALSILDKDDQLVKQFVNDLNDVQTKIHHCKICGNLTEEDICNICSDETRDHNTICVVQDARDIAAIERTEYKGVYHVLNGVISTSKGILPQDINIQTLLDRLNENTKEVILAINPTLDGETTCLYLTKLIKEKHIPVSKLASGIPMGGNLSYTDDLTLIRAMEGRNKE